MIELSRKPQIEREVWHQCPQLVLSVEQRLQKTPGKKNWTAVAALIFLSRQAIRRCIQLKVVPTKLFLVIDHQLAVCKCAGEVIKTRRLMVKSSLRLTSLHTVKASKKELIDKNI